MLSEIAGYIVCDTTRLLRVTNLPARVPVRRPITWIRHSSFLEDWRTQLPKNLVYLILSGSQAGLLNADMRYNQLVVLTTRPVFFAAVKRAVANQVFTEKSSKWDGS